MFELNEDQKLAVAAAFDEVLKQHGVVVDLSDEIKKAAVDAAIGEAKRQLFGF